MASITKDAHQPPKSPFWIACFNGVGSDGRVRRLKRSTKTTDRKLAQRLADEWEQLEKLAGKGRLTESHCRKVIAQMYERTVGEPLHFRTAREHLNEWVESKRNETEQRTYWKYRQTTDEFLAHVGVKADRLLRAACCVILRIEIENDGLAGEGGKAKRSAAVARQIEWRRKIAYVEVSHTDALV